jgi:hypothetical protein
MTLYGGDGDEALSAIAMLLLVGPALAACESDGCGMYSSAVLANPYAGWSDCILRQADEKPLWHGLTRAGVRQQIRFTFTEGHSSYTRVIDFDERTDGTGTIRLRSLRHDPEDGLLVSAGKSRRITSAEVAMIDQLGSSSGTWEHQIGTWDHDEPDQIFLHCETLDMERVTPDGYSFSSVNISCNQPAKLMPLVRFMTGLVDLKPYANGRMY